MAISRAKWPRTTSFATPVRRTSRVLVHLGDGEAEVMEVVAAMGSPITNTPLRDVNVPKGISIGAVVGLNGVRIAHGDTIIEPGDTVVVLALVKQHKAVAKLFKRGLF